MFQALSSCGLSFAGMRSEEGPVRGAAVHATALMGPRGFAGDEVGVERLLHLLDSLEPGAATFDTEVLVEQGAMEALDNTVCLRPLHARLAMLDMLGRQRELQHSTDVGKLKVSQLECRRNPPHHTAPGKQQVGVQAVTPGHRRYRRPVLVRLRNDLPLLVFRAHPPPAFSGGA
jgi:hypothetical protein